jgi:hypothetical protein
VAGFPLLEIASLLFILGKKLTIGFGGGPQLSSLDVALQTLTNKSRERLPGRFYFCDLAE